MSQDLSPPPLPDFGLALYAVAGAEDTEVAMDVHVPEFASTEDPASPALLHGLGIMILDHQGDIARIVDTLFGAKRPSEAEAVRMIQSLLLKAD
ncbi:hypothetical protein CcrC1_gp188 [Caulobacter phage C1]|nr:hypothetical protein CcrC1_gp188 [Caulobacter phage C1]UTU08417.1 hypothetical protein CcrC2_gp189 [Caulobacter phage C2]UTU08934.1 hypothetical protein CcrJ4_gp183 [Caulobacter phage J4]UTU09490.1 hypothetical protein CcrBL47_gp204 [Caulobacter phage BL47]UTU10050.1 hypothetical protein CcrRB23_gp188 [Caulobacter phage RB23]WGN97085.1 hypothetical protein [Bertelyvirus sp.]